MKDQYARVLLSCRTRSVDGQRGPWRARTFAHGTPLRRTVSFSPVLGILLVLTGSASSRGVENEHSIETSPESRWYTIEELQIRMDAEFVLPKNYLRKPGSQDEANNVHLLDLTGLSVPRALEAPARSKQVLANSEAWEDGPGGAASVGYLTVVRNIHGEAPDGRFYLFYAIHDPGGGIAVAVSDSLDGDYVKLARTDRTRSDSVVLAAPSVPARSSHFSSPVVAWNQDEKLWFMYFHYYSNEWSEGRGHQKTALATTADLSSHQWTVWVDDSDRYRAVLPVSQEPWMNSQSTYHSVGRLPNGLWVALLRGVGGGYDEARGRAWVQNPPAVGIAVSPDGRRWAQLPGNPLLGNASAGRDGIAYRPLFLGLGDRGVLYLAWSEAVPPSGKPRAFYSEFDLSRNRLERSHPIERWTPSDGAATPWRRGDDVYVFSGQSLYVFCETDRSCSR